MSDRTEKYEKLIRAQTPKDAVAELMSMGPEMEDYVIELEQSARLVREMVHARGDVARLKPLLVHCDVLTNAAEDAILKIQEVWSRQRERSKNAPQPFPKAPWKPKP